MNHVGWRYFPNPWRSGCGRWWKHWLDLQAFYYDVRDAFQRASRGWGNGDIYDLMSYHAGVTLGLLKHFKANHNGYSGPSSEKYEAKLDLAIDGWEAKYELLTNNLWKDDEGHAELITRWKKGNKAFNEIYDSLWN